MESALSGALYGLGNHSAGGLVLQADVYGLVVVVRAASLAFRRASDIGHIDLDGALRFGKVPRHNPLPIGHSLRWVPFPTGTA